MSPNVKKKVHDHASAALSFVVIMFISSSLMRKNIISLISYLMLTITNVSASFSFFVQLAKQPKRRRVFSAGAERCCIMSCENFFFCC